MYWRYVVGAVLIGGPKALVITRLLDKPMTRCLSKKSARSLIVVLGSVVVAFGLPFLAMQLLQFDIPNRTIFAAVLGATACSMVLGLVLTIGKKRVVSVEIQVRHVLAAGYLLVILYTIVLSLARLFLGSVVTSNPLLLLADFVVVTLLLAFLPGYALVKCLNLEDLSWGEQCLYAILLSILMTSLVGFVCWMIAGLARYAVTGLTLLNVAVLLYFLIRTHAEASNSTSRRSFQFKPRIDLAIVVTGCAVLFLFLSYFTIHLASPSPLPLLGDEFFHAGYVLKLLSNYFSWQENAMGVLATPAYPYFFHLFAAVGVTASGISIAGYLVLASLLLLPLPTIAFYFLSETMTHNRILVALSTAIFQLFSGFGWVFAAFMNNPSNDVPSILAASNLTCDIVFSTWLPVIVAPYLIDLTVFLFSLGLILKTNINRKKLTLLLIPLVLLGILSHLEKVVILGICGLALGVIQLLSGSRRFRTRELALALLASSALVVLIDVIAPKRLFTALFWPGLTVCVLLGAMGLLVSHTSTRVGKLQERVKKIVLANIGAVVLLSILAGVSISIVELLAQVKAGPQASTIPLYLFPLKAGVAGIFVIVWALGLSRQSVRRQAPVLLLLATVVGIDLFLYHSAFSSILLSPLGLDEFRFFRDVVWPPLAVASSIGVFLVVERIRKIAPSRPMKIGRRVRPLLCSLFLALVLSTAMNSHLLKIEYMTATTGIPQDQYGLAVFFSTTTVPPGSAVFVPTSVSNLVATTGALTYTSASPFYGEILTQSNDLASILFMLKYLNISYIVRSKAEGNSSLMQALEYFPVVYDDSSYTVYESPAFSSPCATAETALLVPFPPEESEAFGFPKNCLWVEEFENISGWLPDYSISGNVTYFELLTGTNGIAHLEVDGKADSKIVMFLAAAFSTPLQIPEDTRLLVRFRTDPGTKLLVHILFDDGSMMGATYKGSAYMSSQEWASSDTTIRKTGPRGIVGVRIGVTNKYDESTSHLFAELDYLALSEVSQQLADALAALSLANVRYTFTYDLNSSGASSYDNIIVVEDAASNNGTLNVLLNLAGQGKNVVIMGNLSASKWIPGLISIKVNNRTILADRVEILGAISAVPPMRVVSLEQSGASVLACYSNTEQVPLAIRIPVNEAAVLTYVDICPITNKIRETTWKDQLYSLYSILQLLFPAALALPRAELMNRCFYLKNSGPFIIEGIARISASELLAPENSSLSTVEGADQLTLQVSGLVEVRSYGFGFSALRVQGNMSVYQNEHLLFESTAQELELVIKGLRVCGTGLLRFASLTSGFPYRLQLTNSPFEYAGSFDIDVLPLAQSGFVLFPYSLINV